MRNPLERHEESVENQWEPMGIRFSKAKLRVQPLFAASDRAWLMRFRGVSYKAYLRTWILLNSLSVNAIRIPHGGFMNSESIEFSQYGSWGGLLFYGLGRGEAANLSTDHSIFILIIYIFFTDHFIYSTDLLNDSLYKYISTWLGIP
jgi:hypothetical protein